ncbi:MAG: MliC family protein [Rhodocyclaceae bacterium]|jgi:membrane-bound inhibitor of C-type lysozyme|nr:MliC family protein [Rhodocyclaceae bacterium]MBK6908223.1 MliC family protein [Rhodocyclaceae bacterium]
MSPSHQIFSTAKTCFAAFAAALVLTGCGSMSFNLWPFGESSTAVVPKGYENAVEYRCEGGKFFHVRLLDSGKSAWLMWPERQVRLDKSAGEAGAQYSNGIAVLKIDGNKASLSDGPAVALKECLAQGAAAR